MWTEDEYFNEALFITQNGNLYNGGQLIYESGLRLKNGDTIDLTLDGDMVYVTVNGEQLPASLGPVQSSFRVSVLMDSQSNGVTILSGNLYI
jgi:hypothetical protein